MSTLLQWVVLARLATGKGFGDPKVNDFDCRFIECADKVVGLNVAMHNAERVDVL